MWLGPRSTCARARASACTLPADGCRCSRFDSRRRRWQLAALAAILVPTEFSATPLNPTPPSGPAVHCELSVHGRLAGDDKLGQALFTDSQRIK